MKPKGKQPKGKESLTMVQKIAEVDKKIEARAKQANKADSPTMEKPFDKVPNLLRQLAELSRVQTARDVNYYLRQRRRK